MKGRAVHGCLTDQLDNDAGDAVSASESSGMGGCSVFCWHELWLGAPLFHVDRLAEC